MQDNLQKEWAVDHQALNYSLGPSDIAALTALPGGTTQVSICKRPLVSPVPGYAIPHDAAMLLKHYSTKVLQSLTPYRHSKTPWHILFIPNTKSCLAALTLGEEMDHTSLCAFFVMLAISASSLGVVSGSERWSAQSELCRGHARGHARLMLRTAYDVPKVAKYKLTLMALLTMMQMSIGAGDHDHTEYYFLETEKFIRVRGLNGRKSRKVRLLHHFYAFERTLHKTTFSGNVHSLLHRDVGRAVESCGAKSFSKESLSFKCLGWGDLEQEMRKIKDREKGENDLHVQLPGIWSATLYSEIFGVSETYIFLLFLVIRLERSKNGTTERLSSIGLHEYLNRAKAIESCIQRLRRRPNVSLSRIRRI